MASFVDTIKVIFSIDSNQAKQGLSSVQGEVVKAEGTVGKLKSGIGGFASQVKAGLGDPMTQAVLGVTTAVVAMAGKAITAFQDTALAAGKLADATGVTTQEAGQLLEVFGDVGVSSGSVETGLNKMNKAVDGNREEFAKLGLIGKTTGETFTNVIQYLHGITDPAKRAAEGTRLLGKGWTDMAEIVAAGGDKLTKAMSEVSTHKAITPEQVAQARKFRDTMDSLSDTFDELELTAGETLLPMVQEMASDLESVVDPLNDVTTHVGGLGNALKILFNLSPVGWMVNTAKAIDFVGEKIGSLFTSAPSAAEKAAEKNKKLADSYKEMEHGVRDAATANTEYKSAADIAKQATDEAAAAAKVEADAVKVVTDQYHAQQKALEDQSGARRSLADLNRDAIKDQKDLSDAVAASTRARGRDTEANNKAIDAAIKLADDVQKQGEAQAVATGKTLTAAESQHIWNDKMLVSTSTMAGPLKTEMEKYIATVNGIPPEKVTEFNALVDKGLLTQAQQLLDGVAATRTATIVPTLNQYWIDKQLQALQQKIDTIERNSRPGTAAGAGSAIPRTAAAGANITIRTGLAGSDRAVAREVRRQLNLDRFSAA